MTTVPEDVQREATGVPWRSPTVQIVLGSTLLAPLGVPLVSPALPVIRDAFAVSDAQASLLISTYFLTGIVLSPFIGILADRVGRRAVLVPSLFVFGLLGGALAFAPSFSVLLVGRFVQGTAAAGIFITTVTLIGDAFEGVQRNAVLGMNNAVLSAGAAAFPLLGGALVSFGWNVPFFAYFLGIPVALWAFVALEEPSGERERRSIAYLRGAFSTVVGRETATLYGTAFLTETLLFGSVLTALPFLLEGRFGLSPVFVGLVITVAEVVSVAVSASNGRFARHLSNEAMVASGFALYAVGLFAMWLATSVLLIGVGATAIGAGLGLSMPSVDAAISGIVSPQFRAGALSIRNSTTFLGRALGPVLFAGLALRTGYRPLFFGAGVVALAWAVVVFVVGR